MIKAELKRDWLFVRRYPLEPLSFLAIMFIIMLAFLWGVKTVLPEKTDFDPRSIILGYSLLNFIMGTQMGWSGGIQNESQTGTLEQLCISPHPLAIILLSRGLAQFLRHSLYFGVLLAALSLTVGNMEFAIPLYLILPVLFLTAWGLYGIAYLFAGITLIFKRVGFFFQIVNFGFLALFWMPPEQLTGWQKFLYFHFPLTLGMNNLKRVMIDGWGFGELMRARDGGLVPFAATSILFMLAGYVFFRHMEKRARSQALLSQY